jgi:hypothetical protein
MTCLMNINSFRQCGRSITANVFGLGEVAEPKITKEIAEKIYNDIGSIRFLAKKYNIGKTQVGYIKQGKRWME